MPRKSPSVTVREHESADATSLDVVQSVVLKDMARAVVEALRTMIDQGNLVIKDHKIIPKSDSQEVIE